MVWIVAASCHLDASTKNRCSSSADCVSGSVCAIGECHASASNSGPSGAAVASVGPVVSCDSTTGPSACGSTDGGMTCFQASSLGGSDFCATACDPSNAQSYPTNVECVESGALLYRCHPNSSSSAAADCPTGLNCYRTSLVQDQGVCIQMPVCSQDSDCLDNSLNSCVASVIRSLSPLAGLLQLDHLNCVHRYCMAQRSECPATEGCLGTQFSDPADICVPNCDSHLRCPPDYSCARNTLSLGSPALCLPGIPGERCDGNNCVIGSCEDTGARFSVCTTACSTTADCSVFDSTTAAYVCVSGATQSVCVTSRPYNGSNCEGQTDCNGDAGEFCSFVGGDGFPQTGHGDCRTPCNSDRTCAPLGGVPRGCLGDAGGCYPGILGIPCADATECIAPLQCLADAQESDVTAYHSRICTVPCGGDGGGDSSGDGQCTILAQRGYCAAGSCRIVRPSDQPCQRDAECASQQCNQATMKCI